MDLYEQLAPPAMALSAATSGGGGRSPGPARSRAGDRNLLLENAEGPVGWAMLAFAVKAGPSDERVALRVRIQDCVDQGGMEVLRTAFAGPTPFTAELY
jgi:hypothetical protein